MLVTFSNNSEAILYKNLFVISATVVDVIKNAFWGVRTAVAQWIRLAFLPSGRGFKSQAHHLCFYQFKFELKL